MGAGTPFYRLSSLYLIRSGNNNIVYIFSICANQNKCKQIIHFKYIFSEKNPTENSRKQWFGKFNNK